MELEINLENQSAHQNDSSSRSYDIPIIKGVFPRAAIIRVVCTIVTKTVKAMFLATMFRNYRFLSISQRLYMVVSSVDLTFGLFI